MLFDWTAVLAGAGVGLIVGLTGVGGGSLMTPLLISVFHLDRAVAIGTDLWFAGLTKVSGSVLRNVMVGSGTRITRIDRRRERDDEIDG